MEETSTLIGEQRKGQVLGEVSGKRWVRSGAFVGGVYVEILRIAQERQVWGWLLVDGPGPMKRARRDGRVVRDWTVREGGRKPSAGRRRVIVSG